MNMNTNSFDYKELKVLYHNTPYYNMHQWRAVAAAIAKKQKKVRQIINGQLPAEEVVHVHVMKGINN